MFTVVLTAIAPGEEVVVAYGLKYWKNISQVHKDLAAATERAAQDNVMKLARKIKKEKVDIEATPKRTVPCANAAAKPAKKQKMAAAIPSPPQVGP